MKVYGKIVEVIANERIIRVKETNRLLYLYMSRKLYKDYCQYFHLYPYVFLEVNKEKRRIEDYVVYDINHFEKIIGPKTNQKITYFDMNEVRVDTQKFLESLENKMFLDLEFSLPAYYQSIPHIPEIVQYGLVIEDKLGNIIYEESSLVKPKRMINLNNRTLKFLSRRRDEYDNAMTYMSFYNSLKELLYKYNPKIIAWGRSDLLTLESSFKLNKIKPIQLRKRYINIMQIIKNYYNQKDEIGLFQTYEDLTGERLQPQAHDALEDAVVTRKIYHIFKARLLEEKKSNF